MSVVKVDSQRRIYIPKEISFKADKAIIVPYGASFLLIPVPEKIIEIDVKASIQELKKRAEAKAREVDLNGETHENSKSKQTYDLNRKDLF